MYRYPIIIEKAGENYSAYCPDLPGCIATGKTVRDASLQAKKAIRFHLAGMKKEGIPVPIPSSKIEYISISIPA
jgi:predicted RNase H-like HicB family nuclease